MTSSINGTQSGITVNAASVTTVTVSSGSGQSATVNTGFTNPLVALAKDTFGNVVIEAQASGVPVVVSDSGGPKELVEDKANGLITRSHDVNDFTSAIRTLVTDPVLRERMGDRARKSVIDRSWPSAFRKFWTMTDV